MKPVQMTDVSERLFTKDSLLLLNTGVVGLRYVKQLLARNNTNIRSKGGISLPAQLWSIILKIAQKGTKDRFCLVKADLVSESPDMVVLRCVRHKFDCPEDVVLAGNLRDKESVGHFEHYLACATPSTAESLNIELPELCRLSGPENTFSVVLDTTSTVPCLYTSLDVPDIIAKIDDGLCWVCDGMRFICPGCTGGKAQNFDAFMSCGVDLACPLCIGMDFCQDHKQYLEGYLWSEPPEGEEEEMLKLVEDRLAELGYTDVAVEEGAWKPNMPFWRKL
ncbi:hypothetical protein F5Y06DRAFT_128757 [Hypoxylon sp. FL0890]|nr:hypothetical protein F5Y06DRAFT_128757 [Hypoxylon sp. FL0890]